MQRKLTTTVKTGYDMVYEAQDPCTGCPKKAPYKRCKCDAKKTYLDAVRKMKRARAVADRRGKL